MHYPARGAAKIAAAFILLVFVLLPRTTTVHAWSNCYAPDIYIDSEEQFLVNLINQYRGENGLWPLTLGPELNQSASWMAADMGTYNYFSHQDSAGRLWPQRIWDCGSGAGGSA